MRTNILLDFIAANDKDQLTDYYSKLYDKLQELIKRKTRISFYFLITIIVYFISSKSIIPSFQIGPISLNDITLVFKFLPVICAYLMFDFTIIANQQTEVSNAVKIISKKIYKYPDADNSPDLSKNDFLTRLILPISSSNVLSKLSHEKNKKHLFISALLTLPIFIVAISPVYFEYLALKNLYLNHFEGSLSKICFVISIYLVLVSLYLNLKLMSHSIQEQKAELGI